MGFIKYYDFVLLTKLVLSLAAVPRDYQWRRKAKVKVIQFFMESPLKIIVAIISIRLDLQYQPVRFVL